MQHGKRRVGLMVIAAAGIGVLGLNGCTSSGYESDSDHGWLSGYQADKNNDGQLSRGEVDDAFNAADADGDGSLSAAERSGGHGR